MEKYNHYSFDDFCNDVYFLHYVKGYDIVCNNDWDQWISTNPPNIDVFKQARQYLRLALHPTSIIVDDQLKEDNFKIIQSRIDRTKKTHQRRAVVYSIVSLAAVIAGLLIGLRWYLEAMVTVQTRYGETTMVTLPDSTHVELNSNTQLSYHRAWKWLHKREVWVDGEAYLVVTHLNKDSSHVLDKEHFKVFAGTSTIEVLGTEFNVRHRDSITNVALVKGHLLLTDNRFSGKSIELHSGQSAIANNQKIASIPKEKVNSVAQAWIKKEIVSHGLTIESIIHYYEEIYGKHIVVDDTDRLKKQVDGSISLSNPSIALYTIANLLNADVTIKGDYIYLTINN